MEGDHSDRDRARGDEFPDYRSTARDRATPSGGATPWSRASDRRDGVTYSASAKVPDPSVRPGPYPPVSRPPASYRPESGRPESAGPASYRPESGRPVSGRPEFGPPADWPPRRPAAARGPTTPPQDPWRQGRPRDAWTDDPVPTDRDRWAQPRSAPLNGRVDRNGSSSTSASPRNGRPDAWPAPQGDPGTWPARPAQPDGWPPGNGAAAWPPPSQEVVAWPPPGEEAGGWSPPVIAPPDSTPPAKAPQRGTVQGRATVRGGEAAGWAPPGGRATDTRPEVARGGTPGTGSSGSRGSSGTDGAEGKTGRKGMPLWQELPLLIVVAFCLAVLIRTFLLQAFYIPSGSMEDTLLIGDRVLVNKVVYDVRDPKRGEVVVFKGPSNWVPETPANRQDDGFLAGLGRTLGDLVGISTPGEKDFIKRVIGLPGDTVACCDDQGRVTVNGTALDEPYVTENSPLDTPPSDQECRSRKFGPVEVEDGQLFVMGDHRLVSQDSRCQGQVPIDNVIGRAFVIVWPNSRWDRLPVPATFDSLAAGPPGPARMSTSEVPGTVAVLLPLVLFPYISARYRHSVRGRQRRLAP